MTEKTKIFKAALLFLFLLLFMGGLFYLGINFAIQKGVVLEASEFFILNGAFTGIFFFTFVLLLYKGIYRKKVDWGTILFVMAFPIAVGLVIAAFF